MSTLVVERQKSLSLADVINNFFSKPFKPIEPTFNDTVEIDSKGIHPRFIEIIEDKDYIIVKGMDFNNLSKRLNFVLNKSDFLDIDRKNIVYRAGKIIFKVNFNKKS